MTQQDNNPFQPPKQVWTEHHKRDASISSEEFMADLYGVAALAVLGFSVIGVGLMCVAQIIGL